MADIDELINAAANQQPTRFANAFDEIMRDRIAGRIEDEKIAYAQQMFQTDDDVSDDFDVEPREGDDDDLDIEDFDDEDFEFEEDEFDDEDLDVEFDSTDLEEVEDDGEDS